MNDSSYIIDVVIWPNFLTSSISMREVITTSFLEGIDQKNFLKTFFERCSWFKVNNLGLIWPSNFILVWQKIDTKSQRGHGKNWQEGIAGYGAISYSVQHLSAAFPEVVKEIIHLKRSQNFPKNLHFLPPEPHTPVRIRW